jgi:hydroxyacylglutathione hydrolase
LSELGQPLEIIGGKDCKKVTKTPTHGATFNIGEIAVKALHTPCHTQDSICFFMQDGNDKVVFTGDTLFHGGESFALLLTLDIPFLTVGRLRQVL